MVLVALISAWAEPAVDFKRLQEEFEKALQGEYQSLLHRNRIEREELERSLSARTRLWEEQKAQEQRKYFDEHRDPILRRQFQNSMEQERAKHRNSLASERQKRLETHQSLERLLQEDQRQRTAELKEHLQRRVLPPARLWPKRGL